MITFDFTGKKNLVTGASSSIEAAISKLIVRAGGEILLVSNNE